MAVVRACGQAGITSAGREPISCTAISSIVGKGMKCSVPAIEQYHFAPWE